MVKLQSYIFLCYCLMETAIYSPLTWLFWSPGIQTLCWNARIRRTVSELFVQQLLDGYFPASPVSLYHIQKHIKQTLEVLRSSHVFWMELNARQEWQALYTSITQLNSFPFCLFATLQPQATKKSAQNTRDTLVCVDIQLVPWMFPHTDW